MQLTKTELKDYSQTVNQIIRLSKQYYTDLDNLIDSFPTIEKFFEYVKLKPYIPDPIGIEFVNRPGISLSLKNHYFDCDDRSVLVLSFIFSKNKKISGDILDPIKSKINVVGRTDIKPHHVFVSYKSPGLNRWIPCDPTYPINQFARELFQSKYRHEFIVK